ncbi:heparan-alpha-glucosaminide N-acetyltransferase domain-containing protein [Nitriliruptor alkaliphilus]|uniref:heparan-alpha-glucosaminide N-acetyltransferase domain-containing protein n=1 Tax=Nitriliruptor alkaliphilus TaxID=427918 RepID=UPI000698F7BF|nr:heparan-alpha-glucosaminide N-acetyltransferase domain-containing protein [Nitriliruptor alkaliphilus]
MPATTAATSRTTRPRNGRRRRPPARWDGLDVARGIAVLLATVLVVGALLGPEALGPTSWRGLAPVDTLPGLFLVLAGAGSGWRHDSGGSWSSRRRWRRAGVLLLLGGLVVVARAEADPARLALDELLRLAAATGLAAIALRLPRWLLVPVTGLLLLVPAVAVTGDPIGRGVDAIDPATAWALESALGLPSGGVPLVSLPAAVALVLIGHALGVWAHRRPPGPATGAALGTVGVWAMVATVVTAQVVAPVPALLALPAATAATGVASFVLAAGHLAATWGGGAPGLAATGRVALPLVATGTVAVALIARSALLDLPALAALTAGGAVAAAALAVGRRLDRWPLRA